MLCQEDEYDEAEEVLELGRIINDKNVAIVHYLGIVYRDKARHTTQKGDTLRVKLYRDAERQFEMCKSKAVKGLYFAGDTPFVLGSLLGMEKCGRVAIECTDAILRYRGKN